MQQHSMTVYLMQYSNCFKHQIFMSHKANEFKNAGITTVILLAKSENHSCRHQPLYFRTSDLTSPQFLLARDHFCIPFLTPLSHHNINSKSLVYLNSELFVSEHSETRVDWSLNCNTQSLRFTQFMSTSTCTSLELVSPGNR